MFFGTKCTSDLLSTQSSSTNMAARRFSCCVPTVWSSLPSCVGTADSVLLVLGFSSIPTIVRKTFVAGPLSSPLIPLCRFFERYKICYLLTYVQYRAIIRLGIPMLILSILFRVIFTLLLLLGDELAKAALSRFDRKIQGDVTAISVHISKTAYFMSKNCLAANKPVHCLSCFIYWQQLSRSRLLIASDILVM